MSDGVKETNKQELEEATSMEALLAEQEQAEQNLKRGQFVEGVVVQVNDSGVMVDVGSKSEAVIPKSQLSDSNDEPGDLVKVGDTVKAIIQTVKNSDGVMVLSKREADAMAAWSDLQEKLDSGEILSATCVQEVKGGLIVDLGVRGFVPASLIDIKRVYDLGDYVGEVLELKLIELNPRQGKAVLSRKAVLEDRRAELLEEMKKTVKVGSIVRGKVVRLAKFGAFVDLGGIDGLVHISELAWKHVKDASEVVQVGDEVDVYVISIENDFERISLSVKRAQEDPWSTVEAKFPEGLIVEGTVSRIAKKYIFVEVAEGVEGLVPQDEMSYDRRLKPSDVVRVGDQVKVKVLDVDTKLRRMTLSMKQADPSPRIIKDEPAHTEGVSLGEKMPDSLKALLNNN